MAVCREVRSDLKCDRERLEEKSNPLRWRGREVGEGLAAAEINWLRIEVCSWFGETISTSRKRSSLLLVLILQSNNKKVPSNHALPQCNSARTVPRAFEIIGRGVWYGLFSNHSNVWSKPRLLQNHTRTYTIFLGSQF